MSKLARHLGKLRGYNFADQEDDTQADAIRADPQAHIDALVEAGVLHPRMVHGSMAQMQYIVIQPEPPHEHSFTWQVFGSSWRPRCECGEVIHVSIKGQPYMGPVPGKEL